MATLIEQETEIASATNDAVKSAKETGGNIDFQAKTFTQNLSGRLEILANNGNVAAGRMFCAIWRDLLGRD